LDSFPYSPSYSSRVVSLRPEQRRWTSLRIIVFRRELDRVTDDARRCSVPIQMRQKLRRSAHSILTA
jgi:hypothetical protein